MGFVIYRFPSTTFDAIESSLRNGGFRVEKSDVSKKKRLLARDGIARASIADYTEEKKPEVRFVVATGRTGLLSALTFWPVDFWFIRRVERHLREAGARLIDLRNEDRAQL